jgi:Tfp pilus assembly protein PilX
MIEISTMHRTSHIPRRPLAQRGVVLPIALIMLVIISFAGLLAARNSATFEQFSNNLRTNQVARTSAEDALRQCERIARASVEESAAFLTDAAKIVDTDIAGDTQDLIAGGIWNIKANWAPGALNLITVTPSYVTNVGNSARIRNAPTCIIQTMSNDRFLITSRGLSNDAVVDAAGGFLTSGSEVWFQAILTPLVVTASPSGAPL